MAQVAAIEKQMRSLIVTPNEEEDICVICMGELIHKSILETCSHSFCYECITEWSKKHRQCPICKQESLILLINIQSNGSYTIEELPEPQRREADVHSDLEALDQTYFITESTRLLLVAQERQRGMEKMRRSLNSAKYQDAWETRNFETLADIISQLRAYIEIFEFGKRVEPVTVMQDLYKLEELLKTVKAEPDHRVLQEFQEKKSPKRYTADDYDDYEDDDDYVYYEEYSRKQTRKPAGRRNSNDSFKQTPKKKV